MFCVPAKQTKRELRCTANRQGKVRTRPYKKSEGIPVMTLMIEKDTPKFCSWGC